MHEQIPDIDRTRCVLGYRDLLEHAVLTGSRARLDGAGNQNETGGATGLLVHPTGARGLAARAPRVPRTKGGVCILVVEDDIQVRDLTAAILENEGFETVTANDATEVLGLSDDQLDAIDLLVADVKIPGLDGPALARHLSIRAPELKVIFMSAWVDPTGGEHAVPAGHNFLAKPFGYEDLVNFVRRTLQHTA